MDLDGMYDYEEGGHNAGIGNPEGNPLDASLSPSIPHEEAAKDTEMADTSTDYFGEHTSEAEHATNAGSGPDMTSEHKESEVKPYSGEEVGSEPPKEPVGSSEGANQPAEATPNAPEASHGLLPEEAAEIPHAANLFTDNQASKRPSTDPVPATEPPITESSTDNEQQPPIKRVKRDEEPPLDSLSPQSQAEFLKQKYGDTLQPQEPTIVIPSYSAWFSMRRISEVERESLPEFFTGVNRSKTPQVYGKYRNFMINAYRQNPHEYLTVTACRRNLVGDAATLMRVHHFLDEWGLINYQVEAEARPSTVSPPFTGHWRVKYDTPRGLYPFSMYDPRFDASMQPYATMVDKNFKPSDLSLKEATQAKEATQVAVQKATEDAKGSQGTADPKEEPKETKESHEPHESHKTTEKDDVDEDGWTKKEVLDLLKAAERYPYDWDTVAAVVGKDKRAVVRKFVRQPTDKPVNAKELGPLKYDTRHIPISGSDNAALSVLSFLAATADPEIVKAALGRTSKAMDLESDEGLKQERLKETSQSETESQKEGGSKESQEEAKRDSEEGPVIEGDKKGNQEEVKEGDKQGTKIEDQESGQKDGEKKETTSEFEKASAAALSLAAVRARVFSSNTEKQSYQQYVGVLERELKAINLRMSKFTMLERALDTERREMDRERELLFLDRMHYRSNVSEAQELVQDAAKAAQNGDAAQLAQIAEALKNRQAPQPPLKPVLVFNPPTRQEQNRQAPGNVSPEKSKQPPSLSGANTFRMWTMQPRKGPDV